MSRVVEPPKSFLDDIVVPGLGRDTGVDDRDRGQRARVQRAHTVLADHPERLIVEQAVDLVQLHVDDEVEVADLQDLSPGGMTAHAVDRVVVELEIESELLE